MKKYIGVKIIEAEPQDCPKNDQQNKIGDPGYKVVYEGGYISWSPKKVFEGAYRLIDDMTFGLAIEAMKKGFKVARKGWSGKNMFIYLVRGREVPRCKLTNEAHWNYPLLNDEVHANTPVKICDHIDMKAADGSIVIGWLASQTDMLSEDWQIIE